MAMTIEEIRAKYPQYNDMDDDTLARRFHAKHAKETPFMDFAKSFIAKMNPISTAEAADMADYRRGGTNQRMRALQDAANGPKEFKVQTVSETQTPDKPRMTYEQANAAADRMIAEQRANEARQKQSMQVVSPETTEQGEDYRPGWKYVNGVGWIKLEQ